jgi:hypothetical protein
MTELVKIILYAICSAFVWVDVLQIPFRFPILKRKPFNCQICMSGWLVIFYCLPRVEWLGVMSIAVVASIFLNNLLRKTL